MPDVNKTYKEEYNVFIENYKSGISTAENVGELIARMAQYFCEANMEFVSALNSFNTKAAEIEDRIDDNGKAISSTKAKVASAATDESRRLEIAKININNIECIINSLKSLQKGVLNEYSHVKNM